jgi:di/tricarboxylate transporter
MKHANPWSDGFPHPFGNTDQRYRRNGETSLAEPFPLPDRQQRTLYGDDAPGLKPISSGILWLSLASASTLTGNATIIGAMANLIVIESAEKEQVKIGFWKFFKIGMVFTLLSLVISIALLWLLL